MKRTVYISAYTNYPPASDDRHPGLYHYQMDSATGRLEFVAALEAGSNPSFLMVNPAGTFLYAANEQSDGQVSAFAIEAGSARPVYLGREASHGADPCYLSLDPSGRWLMAANYSSGSLAVYPVQADGSLGKLVEHVQHEGSGPDPERQEHAHAHFIRHDPSEQFVFAVDLGMDWVCVYRQDKQTGRLTAHSPAGFATAPGAGPRHLAYHPSGRFVYLSNELNSTVTACAWDAQAGKLTELHTLSTLAQDFQGENFPSDIHLTPSGEFLYVANRGENSLAAYRVNSESGRLERLGNYACGGDWPRNFAIDPEGMYLLVANQNSGSVAVLRIESDGALSPTAHKAEVEAAVCVIFPENRQPVDHWLTL